jgi:hypothetical protein
LVWWIAQAAAALWHVVREPVAFGRDVSRQLGSAPVQLQVKGFSDADQLEVTNMRP